MRLAPELKSKIDQLWDKFWSGGLSNPLQSIEQMSYLIFMNRLEEMDTFEQKRAQAKKLALQIHFRRTGKLPVVALETFPGRQDARACAGRGLPVHQEYP